MPESDEHAPVRIDSPIIRVVIVEDSEVVLDRVTRLIKDIPHAAVVGQARDGKHGLELVEQTRPTVVLIDVNLPDQPGFALLKTVKNQDFPCVTVLLTNSFEPSVRNACEAAGADHFLHKTKDFERIAEIVVGSTSGSRGAGT
jgi:DNA-binding NarL/FixJ family response regulator